jgi:hypothetical protein
MLGTNNLGSVFRGSLYWAPGAFSPNRVNASDDKRRDRLKKLFAPALPVIRVVEYEINGGDLFVAPCGIQLHQALSAAAFLHPHSHSELRALGSDHGQRGDDLHRVNDRDIDLSSVIADDIDINSGAQGSAAAEISRRSASQ